MTKYSKVLKGKAADLFIWRKKLTARWYFYKSFIFTLTYCSVYVKLLHSISGPLYRHIFSKSSLEKKKQQPETEALP